MIPRTFQPPAEPPGPASLGTSTTNENFHFEKKKFQISLRAEQSAPLYPTCDTLIVARNVNLNTGIFHLIFLTVDKNIS